MILKKTMAIVVAFITWWVVSGVLLKLLTIAWPAFGVAITNHDYSSLQLLARLAGSALGAVVAGYTAVAISKNRIDAWHTAAMLMLVVTPMHLFMVWYLWPLWYHLLFLIPLAPIIGFSGRLVKIEADGSE